jgi:hypothetical protein
MGATFKLLCLSAVKTFVVVDGFAFERLDFCFELSLLHLIVVALCVGPLLDAFGLLFVEGELLLFEVVVLVNLRVLHFEL